MIRYEVIRPPIYIEVYEVIAIGDRVGTTLYYDGGGYREVTIEGDKKLTILEWDRRPIKLGDHIRYDVRYDDFALFDADEIAPGLKLVPMQNGVSVYAH